MATTRIAEDKKTTFIKRINRRISQPRKSKTKKLLRGSCIQRFKFCIELAWKVSVKKLELGSSVPKPAIRDMAQSNLIENIDLWFSCIEARNKSFHTYGEKIAQEVMKIVESFTAEGEALLSSLKTL